jgi:hypothetical protein
MDTITLCRSGATMAAGRDAVEVFRLATLISALKLEKKGIRMTRGYSALSVAKQTTGLRTNDRDTQIARIEVMLEQAKREVLYIDERAGGDDANGGAA